MSTYIPVLFPFPTVGKANKRILQCKQTLKWHLGEKSPKKKTGDWTAFSQRCQHSRLKRPFSLRNDMSNRYSKDFVRKTKQKKFEKIVLPYGNKIYILSRINLKG